ncbi:MAG: PEP-CTERM sorting domain-containing protein [Planctomycetes bacterium]|nr:PEP-CTERM sorting domain-containing protein [Planctomycetota bacterium]
MRRATYCLGAVGILVVCLVVAAPASAYVMLQDANSIAQFDVTTSAGLNEWLVDGTNHMYQQWFWYRVGPAGGEQPINALTLDGAPLVTDTNNDGSPDTLYTRYLGQGFAIDLWYILAGGATGSGTSEIAEIIRINNTSATDSLDFHFFQYADFNLNDDGSQDTVDITGGNTAYQASPTAYVAETVVTPKPSHFEAALSGMTLASLSDAAPTTLSDTPTAGPGDVSWAFEWDKEIAPGQTLLISKDKNIVPEPATMALMGTGLVIALAARRKR